MSKSHSEEMQELYSTEEKLKPNPIDYTYCLNEEKSCIHRRGCKRWIELYHNDNHKDIKNGKLVDETKCIPNYKDKECENSFRFLDRFRHSDGTAFKRTWTQ